MTPPEAEQVAAIAASLTKRERACIANWGDGKTPVPDSIWHGALSQLKCYAPGGMGYILSPLGLAVRDYLRERAS